MEQIECIYDKYIKDFKCKYYITRNQKRFIDDDESVKTFGIKIDKLSKTGNLLESAIVEDVGINELDVKRFIKVLSDGKVTPVALRDIVQDNV